MLDTSAVPAEFTLDIAASSSTTSAFILDTGLDKSMCSLFQGDNYARRIKRPISKQNNNEDDIHGDIHDVHCDDTDIENHN